VPRTSTAASDGSRAPPARRPTAATAPPRVRLAGLEAHPEVGDEREPRQELAEPQVVHGATVLPRAGRGPGDYGRPACAAGASTASTWPVPAA
jgi:hypothetical protein